MPKTNEIVCKNKCADEKPIKSLGKIIVLLHKPTNSLGKNTFALPNNCEFLRLLTSRRAKCYALQYYIFSTAHVAQTPGQQPEIFQKRMQQLVRRNVHFMRWEQHLARAAERAPRGHGVLLEVVIIAWELPWNQSEQPRL